MPLANQKRRLGADKTAVVLDLLLVEVAGKDGVDHTLPSVHVLLQLAGVVGLTEEQSALVKEGVLKRSTQNIKQFTKTDNPHLFNIRMG